MGLTNARKTEDGSYNPSHLTMWIGTESKTHYHNQHPKDTYKGTKKILIFCTDEGAMKMKNDKVFNTGNHPIEMFNPMLHLRDHGFKFDMATVHGNPVVLEMWAYPTKDKHVKEIHEEYRSMMENPKKISDITDLDDYCAIFIPGGHGAMINLPYSVELGKLLHIAHERQLPTIVLCHSSAALLSAGLEGVGKPFPYDGYECMCFTDKTDAFTPKIGYLPGPMPWECQSAIEALGMKVQNTKETGACMEYREMISGDSPKAGDNLGKLSAPLVVKYAAEHNL